MQLNIFTVYCTSDIYSIWAILLCAQFDLSCHIIDASKKNQPISSTRCTQFIYVLLWTIPKFNPAIHRCMWENLMKSWFMRLFIRVNKNTNLNWPLLWFKCYLLSAISYSQLLIIWLTVFVCDMSLEPFTLNYALSPYSNSNWQYVSSDVQYTINTSTEPTPAKKKTNKSLMNRDNKLD